jgi:hypothetical protein
MIAVAGRGAAGVTVGATGTLGARACVATVTGQSAVVPAGPRRLSATAAPLIAEIATIAPTVMTVAKRERLPVEALDASE